MNELEALIILTSIPHLGSIKIRFLIEYFGSALEALNANPAHIASLPDFGPKILNSWESWNKNNEWRNNIELAERLHANIISYKDPKYPKRLLEIPDHPVLLYIQGHLLPSDQRSIAIVGTRNASIYGKEMAEQFAHELAGAGFTIISGLARGIDTFAHSGALKSGRTIAVIGSGLANIYPQENKQLAESIIAKGALISEFPMNTPPDRQNFPQRNRIVSGMTLATLLIEAPVKSGAMITVDKSIAYNRKIFALPGRVDCEDFRGNHHLIKNGKAQLVENAQDVIAHFNDLFGLAPTNNRVVSPPVSLCEEELFFLRQLPNQEISIDELVQLTKLPVMKVNVMVMSLLLKKVLKEYPGKVYKRQLL
jgi:DNA processing protein